MSYVLGIPHKVFNTELGVHIGYAGFMSKLRESGLEPINMADVMKARLENNPGSKELTPENFWWRNEFQLGDGVAYQDGKVKIVLDAQTLRDLSLSVKLGHRGTLDLTPDQYNALEGQEFYSKDLEEAGLHTMLSKSEVKSHPVWQTLARDNHLLSEYADVVFALIQKQHGTDRDHAMNVYFSNFALYPGPVIINLDTRSIYERAGIGEGDFRLAVYNFVGVNPESAENSVKPKPLDDRVLDS